MNNRSVIKFMPYLHHSIKPQHLDFDEDAPEKSALKPQYCYTINIADNQYRIYSKLGSGAFGDVCLAQDVKSKAWVCIKSLPTEKKSPHHEQDLANEIKLLKLSNIFITAELNDEASADQEHAEKNPGQQEPNKLVIKLLPGYELSKYIKDNKHLALLQELVLVKKIIENELKENKGHREIIANYNNALADPGAVASPYTTTIYNTDLKAQNLIFDPGAGTVVTCDYGFTQGTNRSRKVKITPEEKLSGGNPTPFNLALPRACGTYSLLPPEILFTSEEERSHLQLNDATQCYLLGILIADIFKLSVKHNFKGKNKTIHRYNLIANNSPIFDNKPYLKPIYAFLEKMTDLDEEKRPSVLTAHHFFHNALRVLGKHHALKICMLSIDDFLNMDESEQEEIIETLDANQINAVALQASSTTTSYQYYQVRYLLHKASIFNIAPFMLTGTSEENSLAVKKYYDDLHHATLNTEVFEWIKPEKYSSENDILIGESQNLLILKKAGLITTLNVCVIALDDFLSANVDDSKDIINTLKNNNVQVIALENSAGNSIENYQAVCAQLEEAGFFNTHQVAGKDSQQICHQLKNKYDQKYAMTGTKVFQYESYRYAINKEQQKTWETFGFNLLTVLAIGFTLAILSLAFPLLGLTLLGIALLSITALGCLTLATVIDGVMRMPKENTHEKIKLVTDEPTVAPPLSLDELNYPIEIPKPPTTTAANNTCSTPVMTGNQSTLFSTTHKKIVYLVAFIEKHIEFFYAVFLDNAFEAIRFNLPPQEELKWRHHSQLRTLMLSFPQLPSQLMQPQKVQLYELLIADSGLNSQLVSFSQNSLNVIDKWNANKHLRMNS